MDGLREALARIVRPGRTDGERPHEGRARMPRWGRFAAAAAAVLLAIGLVAGPTTDPDDVPSDTARPVGVADLPTTAADDAQTGSVPSVAPSPATTQRPPSAGPPGGTPSADTSPQTTIRSVGSAPTTTDAGPPVPPWLIGAASVVPPVDAETGLVVGIVDGDTFDVRLGDGKVERVRIVGIDAPEVDECFAAEAEAALRDLIGGRSVRMAADVSDRDRFGRLLRYVWVDDIFVNEALVAGGYAIARRYPPDTRHAELLEAAAAREAGRGLWAPDACGPASDVGVRIVEVRYDAPGNDNTNLNGEWVRIENAGASAVSLAGWSLRDESASHRYVFPSWVTLRPGEPVVVYSGCGQDGGGALYWCATGSAIWNNDGDTAFLLDPHGNVVDSWSYRGETTTTTASTTTTTAAPTSTTTATGGGACDPAYPDVCIPPPPPDLDCGDITYRRFRVLPPDPHRFDGDGDGIGCES